jgi:hypothetical protein
MRHYSQSHTRVVLEERWNEQEILPLQELWRECDALTETLRDDSVQHDALLAIETVLTDVAHDLKASIQEYTEMRGTVTLEAQAARDGLTVLEQDLGRVQEQQADMTHHEIRSVLDHALRGSRVALAVLRWSLNGQPLAPAVRAARNPGPTRSIGDQWIPG